MIQSDLFPFFPIQQQKAVDITHNVAVREGEACRTLLPNNKPPAIMPDKEIALCTCCHNPTGITQNERVRFVNINGQLVQRMHSSRVSTCCHRPIEWVSPLVARDIQRSYDKNRGFKL